MDTRDMSIMTLLEMEEKLKDKPEDRKFFKKIPQNHAEAMKFMNRKERRAYCKKNRV